jgi:AbrB family looped-hinge helix DNA binding protein
MELVKAGRSRQVTIPKQIFDSLGLKEGDYVQVEVEGGRIVLTPVVVINKERAKSEFFQLVQKLRTNAEALTEEEIEEEIRTALKESRREK